MRLQKNHLVALVFHRQADFLLVSAVLTPARLQKGRFQYPFREWAADLLPLFGHSSGNRLVTPPPSRAIPAERSLCTGSVGLVAALEAATICQGAVPRSACGLGGGSLLPLFGSIESIAKTCWRRWGILQAIDPLLDRELGDKKQLRSCWPRNRYPCGEDCVNAQVCGYNEWAAHSFW